MEERNETKVLTILHLFLDSLLLSVSIKKMDQEIIHINLGLWIYYEKPNLVLKHPVIFL